MFLLWRGRHALVVAIFGGRFIETTYGFDAGYYLAVLRQGYVQPPGDYQEFSNVAFFLGLAVAATARVVGVLAGPMLAVARVVRLRRVDRTAVLYFCQLGPRLCRSSVPPGCGDR